MNQVTGDPHLSVEGSEIIPTRQFPPMSHSLFLTFRKFPATAKDMVRSGRWGKERSQLALTIDHEPCS